jgi:hypothetical protein
MRHARLMFLVLFSLLAIGAAASTTASAVRFVENRCVEKTILSQGRHWETFTECQLQTTRDNLGRWQHNTALGAVAGTSAESELSGTIGEAEVIVKCKADTFTGELEEGGASKGKVIFEKCSVGNKKETFTKCEVPNIEFKFKDQLVGSPIEDEFKPASGTTFVEITIKGTSCIIKGTYPVTGTQICKLPSGETFKVDHTIECTPAGSKLEFNKHPGATFKGSETVELTAQPEWAVE